MLDREKVIEELEERIKVANECMGNPMFTPDALMTIVALLKEQKWIPVTERLPKSMINRVLVYVQHEDLTGYIGFGHFEKFKGEEMWYDLENNCQFSKRGYTVTHWMETPMPPMEGR